MAEHYLTSVLTEAEEEGMHVAPSVTFDCKGDQSAPCRNYPDAEQWDEGDPASIPQDECWMQGWFDADCWYLDDPHMLDGNAAESVPNVSAVFEVWGEYDGDQLILHRGRKPAPESQGSST